MAVPNEILDGTPPHGTNAVTINAVTYVVNTENITLSYSTAENRTGTGAPNQKLWIRDRYKIAFDLQLVTGSVAFPTPGTTFTRTPPNETAAKTFVVTNVPYEATNEVAIRTAKVEAEEAVGAITTG